MERDFNNEEFELFLKQKADQYKIYPSEKSWRNIHNVLHARWRWFTFGGSLLLLTGLFFIVNDLTSKHSSNISLKNKSLNTQAISHSVKPVSPVQPVLSNAGQTAPGTSSILSLESRGKKGTTVNNSKNLLNGPVSNQKAGARKLEGRSLLTSETLRSDELIIVEAPVADLAEIDKANDLLSKAEMQIAPLNEIDAALSGDINWLEEMAAIKLTARKKSPFNLQFYFSPSVSYRRLTDNNNKTGLNQQNTPMVSGSSNIDRFVDHKPSIGAEIGSNILFTAGRNLTIKTGLQLNYSRYSIKAYKFYFEKASIALNTVGPIRDTITAYTSFRNFSGYTPEELQNQYLQISVPIGVELKLLGNKRLQFNIAGTIQPTYLLLNDTYLLSTDYVNYAKEPSLVRKWNVHTSMEAFVSYKMGGVRWQLGPQFRYQLMSSYNDRYPIKEYLIEYGVKVGVSKTLR